jgi:hypothetical protein
MPVRGGRTCDLKLPSPSTSSHGVIPGEKSTGRYDRGVPHARQHSASEERYAGRPDPSSPPNRPPTRPAPADQTAGAGHPLPEGEGCVHDFGAPALEEERG